MSLNPVSIWERFRATKWWIQLLGWLLLAPFLLALWIWKLRPSDNRFRAAAAVVAVLGVVFYATADAGDGGENDATTVASAGDPTATPAASPSATERPPQAGDASTPGTLRSPSPAVSPLPSPSPSPSPSSSSSPTETTDPAVVATGTVVHVVDGDTLDLDDGTRVRLAQVDAPESTSQQECGGDEATALLAELVLDRDVEIRRPGPPFTDPYGRTLGEVIRSDDDLSVSVELVRRGWAAFAPEYASEDPDLAQRLREAEGEAQAQNRGLWDACGGPHEPIAPPPPPPSDDATDEDEPSDETSNPWGTSSCHPAYDPCVPPPSETGDLDCSDIEKKYPSGVEVDHNHGDPHRLDGDKDGHGCD